MKKITLLFSALVLLLSAALKIGYYTSYEDEELKTTFFFKKALTFQLKFENIFATEGDDKPLNMLRPDERTLVADYCHYRLGIKTSLQTQAELDVCKVR